MYLVKFNNNTVVRGKAHYHLGNYLPFRLCVYFSLAEQVLKMFRLLLCRLIMSLVETVSSPETGFFSTQYAHTHTHTGMSLANSGAEENSTNTRLTRVMLEHRARPCGRKKWLHFHLCVYCEKHLQANIEKKKALLSYWVHKAVYYVGNTNASLDRLIDFNSTSGRLEKWSQSHALPQISISRSDIKRSFHLDRCLVKTICLINPLHDTFYWPRRSCWFLHLFFFSFSRCLLQFNNSGVPIN